MIGSKGGWKLSTIFLSCKVFHDWSIIKLGNILYLLDGSIFAVLFEQHFIASVDKVYWCGLEKRTLHSGIFFFSRIFLLCRVPTFRGQKVAKHGGHQGISFLFFWLNYVQSVTASLWLKSCEDHSHLKSYNGGLWKKQLQVWALVLDVLKFYILETDEGVRRMRSVSHIH